LVQEAGDGVEGDGRFRAAGSVVVTADLVDSSACLLAQIGRNFLFVDRHPE
jgi:hypothetical protein